MLFKSPCTNATVNGATKHNGTIYNKAGLIKMHSKLIHNQEKNKINNYLSMFKDMHYENSAE